MQKLHCALSCNVICLYVSRFSVKFSLSRRIPREVSTIIDEVSTLIQTFKIGIINFGKSSFYHFCLCLLYPFLAKNPKAKLPTYNTIWQIQDDLYYGHSSLSLNTSIALHHFPSFLTIFSPKTKTWTFILLHLHETLKEGEASIFIFFQAPSLCFETSLKTLVRRP